MHPENLHGHLLLDTKYSMRTCEQRELHGLAVVAASQKSDQATASSMPPELVASPSWHIVPFAPLSGRTPAANNKEAGYVAMHDNRLGLYGSITHNTEVKHIPLSQHTSGQAPAVGPEQLQPRQRHGTEAPVL